MKVLCILTYIGDKWNVIYVSAIKYYKWLIIASKYQEYQKLTSHFSAQFAVINLLKS